MPNTNIANREVCDLIFTDYATKIPVLRSDYANVSTADVTGETVFAYGGRGHGKRVAFYGEKGGTIGFETQIQPFKLYSVMSGAGIETTATYLKRKELTCATLEITIPDATYVAGSANVFTLADDCGTPIDYTEAAQVLTMEAGTADGTYAVYYFVTVSTGVQKLSLKNTTFPKLMIAHMSTIEKSEDDEILPYKMIAYKIAPKNEFSLSFSNSGDPATLTFSADLLIDGENRMLDMILLDDEDAE